MQKVESLLCQNLKRFKDLDAMVLIFNGNISFQLEFKECEC